LGQQIVPSVTELSLLRQFGRFNGLKPDHRQLKATYISCVRGFVLLRAANICIFVILNDFCLPLA
jgi:hypothetical protein